MRDDFSPYQDFDSQLLDRDRLENQHIFATNVSASIQRQGILAPSKNINWHDDLLYGSHFDAEKIAGSSSSSSSSRGRKPFLFDEPDREISSMGLSRDPSPMTSHPASSTATSRAPSPFLCNGSGSGGDMRLETGSDFINLSGAVRMTCDGDQLNQLHPSGLSSGNQIVANSYFRRGGSSHIWRQRTTLEANSSATGRKKASEEARAILLDWLNEHRGNRYVVSGMNSCIEVRASIHLVAVLTILYIRSPISY